MGSSQTSQLFENAFEALKQQKLNIHFSKQELQTLFKRFQSLSKDQETITKDQLVKIPEMQLNPLADRIAQMFLNSKGLIDFQSFVMSLNSFHADASLDEKLEYIFNIFDIDKQERINSDNLFVLLKKIVGDNVQPVQLQMLVNCTIQQNDKDKDGKLNYQELKSCLLECNDISSKLTVKF